MQVFFLLKPGYAAYSILTITSVCFHFPVLHGLYLCAFPYLHNKLLSKAESVAHKWAASS